MKWQINVEYFPDQRFGRNPDYFKIVTGKDLVETLQKLMLELAILQRTIHENEKLEERRKLIDADDIPF